MVTGECALMGPALKVRSICMEHHSTAPHSFTHNTPHGSTPADGPGLRAHHQHVVHQHHSLFAYLTPDGLLRTHGGDAAQVRSVRAITVCSGSEGARQHRLWVCIIMASSGRITDTELQAFKA